MYPQKPPLIIPKLPQSCSNRESLLSSESPHKLQHECCPRWFKENNPHPPPNPSLLPRLDNLLVSLNPQKPPAPPAAYATSPQHHSYTTPPSPLSPWLQFRVPREDNTGLVFFYNKGLKHISFVSLLAFQSLSIRSSYTTRSHFNVERLNYSYSILLFYEKEFTDDGFRIKSHINSKNVHFLYDKQGERR